MQFGLHGRVLVAGAPGGVPVRLGVCTGRRANDAEHPLGRVLIAAAGRRAAAAVVVVVVVADKVVDQGRRVGADVAKVDGAAAFGEEEEAVELLEEKTIWGGGCKFTSRNIKEEGWKGRQGKANKSGWTYAEGW